MSWTDQEIDDLAKEASAGMNFSYDPAFFTEAAAMLPVKRTKGILWWWLSTAALTLILAGTWFFTRTTDAPLQARNTTQSLEEKPTDAAQSIKNSNENITDIAENQSVLKSSGEKTADLLKELKDSDVSKEEPTSNVKPLKMAGSSEKGQSPKSAPRSSEKSNLAFGQVEKVSNKKVLVDNRRIVSNPESGVLEKAEILPLVDLISGEIIRNQTKKDKTNVVDVKTTNTVLLVDRLDAARLPESEITANVQMELEKDLFPRFKRFGMFYQLRLEGGQAFVEGSNSMTRSFGFELGTYYNIGRSSILGGVEFQYQALDLSLQEDSRVYGFDLTVYQNLMNYREFYKVNLPIQYVYHVNRSQFQVGLTGNFLIGSKMNYDHLQNGQSQRNEVLYGERKGINAYGLTSSLDYGFKINPLWTIGAGMQWQMIGQVEENLANGKIVKPLSGHIFLRKQFGNK